MLPDYRSIRNQIPVSVVRLVFVGDLPDWVRVYEIAAHGSAKLLRDLQPSSEGPEVRDTSMPQRILRADPQECTCSVGLPCQSAVHILVCGNRLGDSTECYDSSTVCFGYQGGILSPALTGETLSGQRVANRKHL